MNDIKNVIQKEEYISLAVNKYILQTGTIPKDDDNLLDWNKLMTNDYLGTNFNKYNPITKADIVVSFDDNNNTFIKGVFTDENGYKAEYNYLYNFYIDKIFRVNTIPPTNNTKTELLKGSQVLYNLAQNKIVKVINEDKNKIFLPSQECEVGNYFYELRNTELIYKYCKTEDISIEVYQKAPIYLDNLDDLKYIKTKIGEKAYIKDGISWYEYYYEGNDTWIPAGIGRTTGQVNDEISIEDRILSYIPDAKDLVLRRDGGCMLANGDIFCWGNNSYKKAGIENYGQLDKTLKPDYVNTPVMLKVQINDDERNRIKWYNNPYRIKFEKMAMNSTNVCGISPIFNYFEGRQNKFGGDLYCNGQITSLYYENIAQGSSETSILARNRFFAWGKDDKSDDEAEERDEIYLTEIAMVEDTIAVLSDEGKIYTIGRNYNGALGIGSSDKFIIQSTPKEIKIEDVSFKKIFALRDIAMFGAIDSNNYFYIWGERPNGKVYSKPTIVSDSLKFNPDGIFTNSKDFLLKSVDNNFYRTKDDIDLVLVSEIPSTAISASIYDNDSTQTYIYINENMQLEGSEKYLVCKNNNGTNCNRTNNEIFETALNELNSVKNRVNGKEYSSFANVSIYRLDTVKDEDINNFEDNNTSGWNHESITNKVNDGTKISATSFLGRFPTNSPCSGNPCSNESPYSVTKTFSYPKYPNHEVEIEFDFYEIGSWDGERFEIYANEKLLAKDHFTWDGHAFMTDSNITGIYIQDNIADYSFHKYNQTYKYKLKSKLDNNGDLRLKFKTSLEFEGNSTEDDLSDYLKTPPLYGNYWSKFDEKIKNESWGIDNVHIKVKETSKTFICAMTGIGSSSQMYCWGNTGRGIPILSTSLYDVGKISTINKLFISQESEKTSQMAYDNFDDSGNLFLKYPTYIGGFDYPFYFK